jgi:hypothetical protein
MNACVASAPAPFHSPLRPFLPLSSLPCTPSVVTGSAWSDTTSEGRLLDSANANLCGRFAACPMCSYRLSQTRRRAAILSRAGVSIVCVFANSQKQMSQFYEPGVKLPFPILMDPDSSAHDAYGTELSPTCVSFELLKAMCGKQMMCPMVKSTIERGKIVHCRIRLQETLVV